LSLFFLFLCSAIQTKRNKNKGKKREKERFDIIPPALATHPPAHHPSSQKKRDLCIDVFHVSTLPSG
jgi:hypothetical protein